MQKKFDDDNDDDNENHRQVGDHCYCTGKYRGVARSICNLRHRRPKEIRVVLRKESNYDYHFIIKRELTEKFDGQFECLGKDIEKYMTFLVPVKKRK